jgi:hypothetical protein
MTKVAEQLNLAIRQKTITPTDRSGYEKSGHVKKEDL